MLDVEQAQPALLAHGERDEAAELDELGLAEMAMQPCPERLVGIEMPGDRLGVGERGLLALVVAPRLLEVEEIHDVVLHHPGARRLDRALVAAIVALHRARDIRAAELLDRVVADAAM